MESKKTTKGRVIEDLNMSDLPQSFMQTISQIKQDERGTYKLRARNEKVYAELLDLANLHNTKVIVNKSGTRIFYTIVGLGITVSLENS